MDRRSFGAMLMGAALSSGGQASQPESLWLSANDWVPNNAELPVLLYRSAFISTEKDAVGRMEGAFAANGWPPQWRNGVYDFHHYHSTTHEVLGFAGGQAQLMLGGPGGHLVSVRAGDVALLPVGTGHCRISASPDFLVVGAYPPGARWDIRRTGPDTSTTARMEAIPPISSDPVYGGTGLRVKLRTKAHGG